MTKSSNPFLGIVRSRKTWWAVLSLIGVLMAYYSGLPTEVQGSILALGIAMISSIAWEDSSEKGRPTTIAAGGDASVTNTLERKE